MLEKKPQPRQSTTDNRKTSVRRPSICLLFSPLTYPKNQQRHQRTLDARRSRGWRILWRTLDARRRWEQLKWQWGCTQTEAFDYLYWSVESLSVKDCPRNDASTQTEEFDCLFAESATRKCHLAQVCQHTKYWKPLLIMFHPLSNYEHHLLLYFKRWLWFWWNYDLMFHIKTWPTDFASLSLQCPEYLLTGCSSWMFVCPRLLSGLREKSFGRPCISALSFFLKTKQLSLLTVFKRFVWNQQTSWLYLQGCISFVSEAWGGAYLRQTSYWKLWLAK